MIDKKKLSFYRPIILLIILGTHLIFCSATIGKQDSYGPANDKLNQLFKHIELALQFYENNFSNMNVDGLYGLKCLQGDIDYVNTGDFYINGKTLTMPSDIDHRLYSMRMRSQTVIVKAKELLVENNNAYYKKMGFIINNQWRPSVYFRMVKPSLIWSPTPSINLLKENESDECICELFDVSSSDSSSSTCQVSDKCLNKILLSTNTCCYTLTHQLLYTIFVSMFSCQSEVNRDLKKHNTSLFSLQYNFCSNIWREVQSMHNKHRDDFPKNYQDLYMQQFYLCATIGFVEFYNETVLSNIYEWQNKSSGCFEQSEEYYRKEIQTNEETGRHLLAESRLQGGCWTHLTAMGLCSLTQYLRLFLDTRPSAFLPGLPNYILDIINERQAFQKRALPTLLQDRVFDTAPLSGDDQRSLFIKDHFKVLHENVKMHEFSPSGDVKYDYDTAFDDPDLEKIRQDVVKRRQNERESALKEVPTFYGNVLVNGWSICFVAVILCCICYVVLCRIRTTRYVLLNSCSTLLSHYQATHLFTR